MDGNGSNTLKRAEKARGLQNKSSLSGEEVLARIKAGMPVHESDLPPLPKTSREINPQAWKSNRYPQRPKPGKRAAVVHPLRELFKQAEQEHLDGHEETGTWTDVPREDAAGEQVLDSRWVYVYKTDSKGFFTKCKARVVVRGDQQKKSTSEETYAATMAGRSFRSVVATAAHFDLDMVQYDVVNAFVNAKLPFRVHMRHPHGYAKQGKHLRLLRALYGLRASPLLWQQDLTATLKKLGFEQLAHEPCCFKQQGILLFVYVDDIVVASPKGKRALVQDLMAKLAKTYELSGGGPLEWFLGIRVLRDREKRVIWLSQAAYLQKISKLITKGYKGPDDVPMTVHTRVDVAFAGSRLSRFLRNPGPQHYAAADQALAYARRTESHALKLGGGRDCL
jgi:reverse transcriptase-like protein